MYEPRATTFVAFSRIRSRRAASAGLAGITIQRSREGPADVGASHDTHAPAGDACTERPMSGHQALRVRARAAWTRSLAAAFALPMVLLGCVAYEGERVTLETEAASLPRYVGTLSFEQAVQLAFSGNAELKALEAEAQAAGADVMATELQAQLEDERLALMIDPIALLGLGQRGASATLADERAAESAARLAEARWQTLARIAELFARRVVVETLAAPSIDVDVDGFVRAGLASPVAANQVRSARQGADAEKLALAALSESLGLELAPLLGLAGDSRITLEPAAPGWPPPEQYDDARLLARPDLVVAAHRYRTADAEFRKAVADQYPSLMLGPDIPLKAGSVDPMALLRIPLGAAGPAEAARHRRSAERSRISGALAAAASEARASIARHEVAAARARATRASAEASLQALSAAITTLGIEVDGFERVAEKAPMALRDAMEAREAALAEASSRVARAIACGWPQGARHEQR